MIQIETEKEWIWKCRRFLVRLPWVSSVRLLTPWISDNLYMKSDEKAYCSKEARKYRRENKWRVI